MMAKPMKTLELHYPMIQFLIIYFIHGHCLNHFNLFLFLFFFWRGTKIFYNTQQDNYFILTKGIASAKLFSTTVAGLFV